MAGDDPMADPETDELDDLHDEDPEGVLDDLAGPEISIAFSPRQILGGFVLLAALILLLRRRRRQDG
jgi:MYXO-CTERM domain-containing protein